MARVIIGIDPASSRLAAVVAGGSVDAPILLDSTKRVLGTKWSPEMTAAGLAWAWDLLGVARGFGDPVVYLESPVVGRGGVRSTMVQAFTSGAVQAAFTYEDVPIRLVNVSTWKKELASGQDVISPTGKPAVGRLVGQRWPAAASAAGGDEDILDAAGIALYGLRVEGRARRLARDGSM